MALALKGSIRSFRTYIKGGPGFQPEDIVCLEVVLVAGRLRIFQGLQDLTSWGFQKSGDLTKSQTARALTMRTPRKRWAKMRVSSKGHVSLLGLLSSLTAGAASSESLPPASFRLLA